VLPDVVRSLRAMIPNDRRTHQPQDQNPIETLHGPRVHHQCPHHAHLLLLTQLRMDRVAQLLSRDPDTGLCQGVPDSIVVTRHLELDGPQFPGTVNQAWDVGRGAWRGDEMTNGEGGSW
jgi:hypothetical protein